ncbi:hypothetical protein LDVICp035 [lymphocystis disease virus-China]|uniref:Uncharacterized protein n=1 Tax=lymphocystis disease virus-China TaxID=256729 RepID=Q678H5_9VIRU|nr:hypothetical protein LDVICp035 [lymphocystis disease virus-China]AAU10882.1 hypothetical protein [lymphocystis disease virus-China]
MVSLTDFCLKCFLHSDKTSIKISINLVSRLVGPFSTLYNTRGNE